MPFITQGKTNIKYLLIVVILATVLGGGVLGSLYLWVANQETKLMEFPEIKFPEKTVCNWRPDIAKYGQCEKMLGYYYDGEKCQPLSGCDLKGDKVPFLSIEECKNQCEKDETASLVLFEKKEGWGPCPPGEICEQSTKIYYSGEVALEGHITATEKLDSATVENLKNQIRSSMIMEKNCEAAVVIDYSAKFKIDLDGQSKEITFPGCEEELNEIEKLILLPKENEEGFCGSSTLGNCASNSDCKAGGCSAQVCESKNEEPEITTCEYRDCYSAENYGLSCKCKDSKCQWSK